MKDLTFADYLYILGGILSGIGIWGLLALLIVAFG
jgi:hypothetical protein